VIEAAAPGIVGVETLESAQTKLYELPVMAQQLTAIIHWFRMSNRLRSITFDDDVLVEYGMIPVEGKKALLRGAKITASFTSR
jgi:hypothetical protein